MFIQDIFLVLLLNRIMVWEYWIPWLLFLHYQNNRLQRLAMESFHQHVKHKHIYVKVWKETTGSMLKNM